MGRFATTVQEYLHNQLADQHPAFDWETEHTIAGTPVDVSGKCGSKLYLLELEWRRADPADNAAKLFRHLDSGIVDGNDVDVFQVFTDYYNLSNGGVSSKRENSEFVGNVAADTIDSLSYTPIDFKLDPPKRDVERPDGWEAIADDVVTTISRQIADEESTGTDRNY